MSDFSAPIFLIVEQPEEQLMTANNKWILRTCLALIVLCTPVKIWAQIFPNFPPATEQTNIVADYGISSAQVPNDADGAAIMAVYSSHGSLAYSIGVNDTWGLFGTPAVVSGVPLINCASDDVADCYANVAVYQGKIYVSYADNTGALTVLLATPLSGGTYSFTEVLHDTTVGVTTVPAMAVFNNRLILIFGTNQTSLHNAFFEVTYNGTVWSPPSDSTLGAPGYGVSSGVTPGLAALNGKLFLCSQQNNPDHNLFVYDSSDGLNWSFVEEDTGLQVGGGIQMVSYKNTLVLANEQNNSNRDLFIFSSVNGTTWTGQGYSYLQMGGPPALSLFEGEVTLQFRADNSSDYVYTSYVSQ